MPRNNKPEKTEACSATFGERPSVGDSMWLVIPCKLKTGHEGEHQHGQVLWTDGDDQ